MVATGETTRAPVPAVVGLRQLSTFGRSMSSFSDAQDADPSWSAISTQAAGRGLTVRGAGQSYSDAALNSAGTVALTRRMSAIGPVRRDVARSGTGDVGLVELNAGVALVDLLRTVIPEGWTPPVLPGTARATVGGAVAADVHGKNHERAGSIGAHVRSLVLLVPGSDEPTVLSPDRDPAAFWATVGGLGLTGLIRRVQLELVPLDTTWMAVRDVACGTFDQVLSAMSAPRGSPGDHVVAWVDAHARGPSLGRGVVTSARHLRRDELSGSDGLDPLRYAPSSFPGTWPLPVALVRPAAVRATNAARFVRARTRSGERAVRLSPVFHPLDAVAGWPTLYGRHGLVQYQFAVPAGEEDVLAWALAALGKDGCSPSLAVLKRLGSPTLGPLSFPIPGWTLALDLPTVSARRARTTLDRLDQRVIGAGGRVYLVKDSRLHADHVQEMYPRLEEWRGVRDRLDPDGVMTSDLDRRLRLSGRSRPC